MNLCSSGHNEVCYETRECPCCEIMEDSTKKIDALENRIVDLEEQVHDLKNE